VQPALHRGGDDHGTGHGPIFAFELDLLDACAAPFDLFRRDQDLPYVFVGLAEVLLQLRDALVQALEIVYEMTDLGMNLVGGFPHPGISLNLLDHLDGEHQQGR
jgi:hypothetical protein